MSSPAEDQRREWKASWRDEHLKIVCAFANSQGGVLEIGRDDKGKVTGILNARRSLEELPNKARDILGIMVAANLRTKSRKEYLEIVVESYPNPISYKGEYYVRSGSTTQLLKGAALDRFILRKYGRTWDSVPLPDVDVGDLDAESLKSFRRLALKSRRLPEALLGEPDRNLLEKLHLTERHYLTRAAALLFHPDPERFFRGAAVKIGHFASESDLRYHDEVQGSLFMQAQKVLDLLLTKYLKAVISYEGIHRVESFPMPEPALREAVLNAIVHRDYAVPAPIQIRVYDNRLSIWNPGTLPEDWSLEKLLGSHASQPYNPNIANAFFRAGEIETWGRGIERVFAACRAAETPPPRIRVEPGEWWFEFPFSPEYLKALGVTGRAAEQEQAWLDRLGKRLGERLGETESAVLSLIHADPAISTRTLAESIGVSMTAIDKALARLKKKKFLRHLGPARGGRWEVLDEASGG